MVCASLPAQERFVQHVGFVDERNEGDHVETFLSGGLRLRRGAIEVRAEQGVIIADREQKKAFTEQIAAPSGLPRRGFDPIDRRRKLSEEVLRDRLDNLLGSFERKPSTESSIPPDIDIELVRSFYLEGGVSFVHEGREVLHADRVYLSVVDDRAVFENVELRLYRRDRGALERVVVVRCDKLVRQSSRFTGRDLSITTSDAGEPHFEILSGEAEIIERGSEFEIRTRDNAIAFSGNRWIPLPSARHFTGSPLNYYIQGARAAYTNNFGAELTVDFGAPMNGVGGDVHEFLTGRPASEFRGNWRVGLGVIEKRGVPIEPELQYQAEGLYEGRILGFNLDDNDDDVREIRTFLDGTPIDAKTRQLARTENRIWLNDKTTLDLQAWWAKDPAVFSEFFQNDFITNERPESVVHFRHQARNYSLQALGRWNLASFSYESDRSLANRFVEQEPDVRFDWIGEELTQLPDGTPVLLDTTTAISQLRSDFDTRFQNPVDDETTRFDQAFEVSVPFRIGDFGVRAFAGSRYSNFSNTVAGSSRDRWLFTAGASVGTRLERTWRWFEHDADRAMRHVISPTVAFEHRYKVDGDPSEFHQFDAVDALNEGANVRVAILQRFQLRTWDQRDEAGDSQEFLWIDLAQNFSPISERDNGGDHLGLAEYEIIFRPNAPWTPLHRFQWVFEGEHDWNENEMRTFNTFVRFEELGLQWFGGYRTDNRERGIIQYGFNVPFRKRWTVGWNAVYDAEQKRTQSNNAVLVRNDHDWQIVMRFSRQTLTDETTFSIDFIPDFGGVFKPRTANLPDPLAGY